MDGQVEEQVERVHLALRVALQHLEKDGQRLLRGGNVARAVLIDQELSRARAARERKLYGG